MPVTYTYPLGLCRPAHPPGYSVRAQYPDRGHVFCFFDDAGEERMARLDESRLAMTNTVADIMVEHQNVQPSALVGVILAYKHHWEWLVNEVEVRENHVYMNHMLGTSVGFGWVGSLAFTGVTDEAEVYSTYLWQYESIMLNWLLAQALFAEAFNAAPISSALQWPANMSDDTMCDNVRCASLAYMKAYYTMATTRKRHHAAFAMRAVLRHCDVAEVDAHVMDAMMALCHAMAARVVAAHNEALYERMNHATDVSRMGDIGGPRYLPLVAVWARCANMFTAAMYHMRASAYVGAPVQSFAFTMRHLAMAKVYTTCAEYLFWKSSASVELVDCESRQLMCLELARRSGHIAYMHGTMAILDEIDGMALGDGGVMCHAIDAEVYEHILPESDVTVHKAMSWARMMKPLTDGDAQRTSSDTTYIILPYHQREIHEEVADSAQCDMNGIAYEQASLDAYQWLVGVELRNGAQ